MKLLLKIIKGVVTAFLLVVLVLVIFQKITKNKITIGNVYIFQVVSGSMVPDYKLGDIIVVKKVNPESLEIGDDVTYLGKSSNLNGLTITHRIVQKEDKDGKYHFITKGIANEAQDPEINEDDIYGKVIYNTKVFSFVGRLMTNAAAYYLLFITVGAIFAYDIITSFVLKEDEEDE
ncbi:MAG: signal peptidase I [Bacilli bacterium]|nr:signal peptidase I [Bacilli bacterium]